MNREDIEDAVSDILIEHGPDGHCDGYKEITDYIMTIVDPRLVSKIVKEYKIDPLIYEDIFDNDSRKNI